MSPKSPLIFCSEEKGRLCETIGARWVIDRSAEGYRFWNEDGSQNVREMRRFGKKIRELTNDIIAEYDVVTPGVDIEAKCLSGGNLQKLILARVLSRKPRLLIVDLPTQGLDVGATEFVRNKLIDAKKEGAGVLLISEDLDEVLSLSDWVAPIYEGEFMGILPGEDAKLELVGAMMAGIHLDEESA